MDWRSPAVEEIEALAAELSRLAALVDQAEAATTDGALWEASLSLQHVSRRAQNRADDLTRVLERRRRRRSA
ncbi:MAG TPA: hypothetical protein VMW08_09985 [Acidimicrobiales bacterium]|nr:hypothetical protein [Acidimicrobiales bacterium]